MTTPHLPYDLASCSLKTVFGSFNLFCFSWGPDESDNVLALQVPWNDRVPIIRVQSACFTGEIFRSTDCDCHEQLERSLQLIQEAGGLFVYLIRDGRGAGIFKKVQGLRLGESQGLDTADAYEALGLEPDPRTYDRVADVLRYFGVVRLNLLTNNPRKVDGLQAAGLEVERIPIEIEATPDSYAYLRTKRMKMGHLLDALRP